MTRINSGIRPCELPTKLLLAEHREIKRIPNCILKGRYSLKGQPKEFTLGTGHVKFYYDKQKYLALRYLDIYDECRERGLNVTYFGRIWADLFFRENGLWNDWQETLEARELIKERIESKGFKLL